MSKIINLNQYKSSLKDDNKFSDISMFAIMYFQEHFEKDLSHLDSEIKYALIISVYRYIVEAEKAGEVIIDHEGFSIEQEASDDLRRKIKEAINFDDISLHNFH